MNFKSFSIINPTGGLHYHLRAYLNRGRWQPFCDMVEIWLEEWSRTVDLNLTETLVLIGPNAGYTLPLHFLEKFKNIVVVEPDSFAYLMFRSRFVSLRANVTRLSNDFFGLADGHIKISGLFKMYPQSAFLFCNVLGQLPLLLKKNKKIDVELYMKNLSQVFLSECNLVNNGDSVQLNSRLKMASYHDRFSTIRSRSDEVIDHLTGDLFNSAEGLFVKREFPWQLTYAISHQIEFAYNMSCVNARQRSGK